MLIMILSTHAPTIDMKIKKWKKEKKKKVFFFYINLQGSNLCHEGFLALYMHKTDALNPSAILAQ